MLDVVAGQIPAALSTELDSGTADPAFMLKGANGALWLLVGADGNMSYLTFAEVSPLEGADYRTSPGPSCNGAR